MKFSILLFGILISFICLFSHIIIWRWKRPRRRTAALFFIFIIAPAIVALVVAGAHYLGFLPDAIKNLCFSIFDWLAIYLLHSSLSLAYILSYPAVEAASPSLVILLMIGDANPKGLHYEELSRFFDGKVLLQPRIQDLTESALITESDGYFKTTSRGSALVNCFIFLRRLLGLPIGKG